ncbi:MAG TPA: lactate racemase domain-containing protein, partial [Spirochaetia bacterium]|nr:lactate racemase domain-containing protein [Spirochaetia bacterium]
MSIIDTLLDPIPIPQVIKVRQTFPRPRIEDGEHDLVDKLEASGAMDLIRSGQSIGIAVGSRGVTSQPLFVHVLVREIRKAGGKPFLFPAMGSHGGATADGQTEMLRGMGFGEEYTGAPIRATMEVVQIGESANGLPVYLDRYASEADGIVIINRIKPHVAFRGPFESGLMKMMAIGMAKQKGAEICHELGFGKMAENIPAIGRVVLASKRVLFGVGLLENAYHETCRIEVLRPEQIEDLEPELQEEAKRLAPKLLFDRLDVLIIDEIGKDISGTGFDTNVVGRYHTPYCSGGPSITRIAALDVTEASHGNANGLGILDFTTRRAFDKFDFENTYPNSLTSTLPTSVKIPMVLKNQKQAVQAAIKTCNILDKTGVRFVRIK